MKTSAPAATRPTSTKQSLARTTGNETEIMSFDNLGGSKVELSVALTKKYFCPSADAAECYVFNEWCKHNRLDPWRKEAYLVKYGSNPAQMITAKDAYTRRAESNPRYQGQQAGVIVLNRDGELENRMGEIVLDGESIVGGWAKVYVKDYVHPVEAAVGFRERCQYKSDGSPMAKWATAPALMIRKCALVAALREAFPSDVGGLYTAEELGFAEDESSSAPIIRPDIENAQEAEYSAVDPSTGEVKEEETQSEFEKEFFGK